MMIFRAGTILAVAVTLAGCNTTAQQTGSQAVVQTTPAQQASVRPAVVQHPRTTSPQQAVAALNIADARYNTAGCQTAREKAMAYDDRIGQRVVAGAGIGLLLGPFGLPLAAAVDVKQSDERFAVNHELVVSCIANGEQLLAEQKVITQIAERETQNRTTEATP